MLAGYENSRELRNGYRISAGNHKGKKQMSDIQVDDMTILKRVLKEIRYECFD
jgi:hypothetical protein